MGSPYWIKTFINKTFSQRFFWAKLTHYPFIGRAIDHALFEGDDIFYVPSDSSVVGSTHKDKTLETKNLDERTKRSIPIHETVKPTEGLMVPSKIVDHFIKQANYRWIMDFCICRDSTHCKDYPLDLGCIFLGEAVKDINPRFGREVTKEEALAHAAQCREAGLVHLIGRNKLDSVWLNVSPGEKLLTICNCCPCCCLWKILPTVSPHISEKINRLPGLTVRVTDSCVGCGTCTKEVCFVNAINLEGENARIDQNKCRGCGRCVNVCPNEAIEMIIEDSQYIDRSIKRLSNLVDVT
jgi:ferredoxin